MDETKKAQDRIAAIADSARAGIDDGTIKLSPEAAARELARKAECKHEEEKLERELASAGREFLEQVNEILGEPDRPARVVARGVARAHVERVAAIFAEQQRRPLERPAPTPPPAAYSAPIGAMFCCGNRCPGLAFRASPKTPHPSTCLSVGQVDGDQEVSRTLLTEVVEGLLGKNTPECRLAVETYLCEPPPLELVTCPRCGGRMEPHAVAMVGDGYHCECGISCTAEAASSAHVRESFAATRRRAAEAATVPNEKEQAALAFCFRAAAGDSGGQRRVRQFLFSWHNARELGGFDFADLWSLDEKHLDAVLTVALMIARGPTGYYPHHYGYESDMEALIETYGPDEAAQ